MSLNSDACYVVEPLECRDGIPVFSTQDSYTDNYERISCDHLDFLKKHGSNPWISETLWIQMEEATVALIEEYSQPGAKILDIGVGLGRLLEKVPAWDRYGCDISFSYLNITRQKGINVCYARAEELPYQNEFFDVVVCSDVLEHVVDLNRVVAKMLAVLNPEGVLIVRVPYREDMTGYTSPELIYEFVHLRDFNEHSLKLLFTKIFDCEVLATRPCGYQYQGTQSLPYPYGDVLKTDLWLDGLKKIHPDLFWTFLRHLGIPSEICMVIKKKTGNPLGDKAADQVFAPSATAPQCSYEELRSRYFDLRQKIAFVKSYYHSISMEFFPLTEGDNALEQDSIKWELLYRQKSVEHNALVDKYAQLSGNTEFLNQEVARLKQALQNCPPLENTVMDFFPLAESKKGLEQELIQLELLYQQKTAEHNALVDKYAQLSGNTEFLNQEVARLKQALDDCRKQEIPSPSDNNSIRQNCSEHYE